MAALLYTGLFVLLFKIYPPLVTDPANDIGKCYLICRQANNMKALRVLNRVQRHYIKYQSTSPSANLSVHFPLNVATEMSLQLGVVADGSVVPTDVTISNPAVEFVSFHLKSTLF